MSTMPIQSGNPLQELARTLLKNFDANGDGKLGVDEFASLLTRLSAGLNGAAASTASASAPASTTPVFPAAIGQAGRSRLEGFDERKLADTSHATPKYIFARAALHADLSSVRDQASAEQVLRGMLPELQGAGLDVKDVRGDSIQIVWQGRDQWIDVVRGASGSSPAFQWLPLE